jgi:predicted nucleic acid-binding protein
VVRTTIIAATAVAYKSPAATLNFRELQKIEGLEVLALSPTPSTWEIAGEQMKDHPNRP